MARQSLKSWILAGAAVAVVAAVAGLLWQVRSGSSSVTTPAPATATPAAPSPPARAVAPRVDTAPAKRPTLATPPRATVSSPPNSMPPLRHAKNAELIETLKHRADLLQKHVNDAEMAGHAREAAKGRMALRRLRQKIAALGTMSQEAGEDPRPPPPAP